MAKELPTGTYVVAVSGGVDSGVLLDMLASQPGLRLIVAHYDHGIREDSAEDREHVEALARNYKLPFIYEEGKLGKGASEDAARQARYEFLRRVKKEQGADKIVTAHHQDDLLETVIHNLTRGTGRLGLAPMRSSPDIVRPLIDTPKSELLAYAKEHKLKWREDSTNSDETYKRNYIRHKIVPRLSPAGREKLLKLAEKTGEHNQEIDKLIRVFLRATSSGQELHRHDFIMLDHALSREVMAAWLRANSIRDFDKTTIERLTHAAKTFSAGKRSDVNGKWQLKIKKDNLALVARER
jgi:tRNA(Ile)-lysidine synthase